VNNLFISLRVFTDKDEGKNIWKRYSLRGTPTVLFLNSNGDEIDRICGFEGNKDAYFQTIKDYANNKKTLPILLAQFKGDSNNVDINFKLAQKYTGRWERENAHRYYAKILKLDPNNQKGYQTESLFQVAVYNARVKKNISTLESFMANDPVEKYFQQGYSEIVRYYKRAKNNDKLIETYEVAINKIPGNAYFMNEYARFIYQQKIKSKYNRAIELAKQAIEIKPDDARIWDTLAWLQFEQGNQDEAIMAMEKAVQLAPDNMDYKKNLEQIKKGRSKL